MYVMLEKRAEIRKAQRELEQAVREGLPQRVRRDIGWQGGRRADANLQTDGRFWFFTADLPESSTPRNLNFFGRLGAGKGVAITVEVNTPHEGISLMAGGFFARSTRNGRTYLFHSGRVAGGRPGVKKDALVAWCDLDLTPVATSSGELREGIIVMPTSGRGAVRSALEYVQAIIDFKAAVRAGKTDTPAAKKKVEKLRSYYDEFFGRKRGKISRTQVDYESRHGEVVKALHDRRRKQGLRQGERMVKNRLLDLGVADGNGLFEAYEVKSSPSRGEIYTAIGQLIVHGGEAGCAKTLVIPRSDALPGDISGALERHEIGVQFYRLTDESVEFD